MSTLREYIEQRLIPEPNTGCWLWTKALDEKGYGHFSINSKHHKAHRAAYQVYNGDIPKGLSVCHSCDIRSCVNPHHLYLGTHKENMQDMVNKKRSAYGERSAQSKLTNDDVLEIRASKLSSRKIGKLFGVGKTTINSLRSRHTWKHI